jgi:hypothetical protein
VLAVPILVAEAAFLLSLVWPPTTKVDAPAGNGLVAAV